MRQAANCYIGGAIWALVGLFCACYAGRHNAGTLAVLSVAAFAGAIALLLFWCGKRYEDAELREMEARLRALREYLAYRDSGEEDQPVTLTDLRQQLGTVPSPPADEPDREQAVIVLDREGGFTVTKRRNDGPPTTAQDPAG